MFFFAEFIAFYSQMFETANSELSGVFSVYVALPWSILLVHLWKSMGFHHWHGRYAGAPALHGWWGVLAVLLGVILNVVIAYLLGTAMDGGGAEGKRNQPAE